MSAASGVNSSPSRTSCRAGGSSRLTASGWAATTWGLALVQPAALRGGDVEANVAVARAVFAGERGPVRDAVVLNAAAGLATHAGLSGDLSADMAAGVERAGEALDSGAAGDVLDRWVLAGRQLAAD